jgi:Phage gp6-like head-tail connector protein
MAERIELVTPPAVEPVTLDDLKNHLRVDITDDDALITSLGIAARRLCEVFTARSFITTVWDAYYDSVPMGGGYWNRDIRRQGPDPSDPRWLPTWNAPFRLGRAPLQSVQSFTYMDMTGTKQILDLSILRISLGSPGRVQPIYGKIWPFVLPVNDAVVIRFTAGYGDTANTIPETIKAAIRLFVGHLYENREAVSLVGSPAELPLGVRALLGVEEWGASYA